MILITAAYPIEARWVARRPGVRVVRTAVGELAGTSLAGLATEANDVSHLLAAGFCGGIDPVAQTGELFLAQSVRHHDREFHIDPDLLNRAQHALNGGTTRVHIGVCESADHVLGAAEKRALNSAGVTATDMESGPLARWAEDRGIPVLVLRVVLDPSETDLPFTADRPLWRSVLCRPVASARVWRDALHTARVLGTAVNTVVDALRGGRDD